MEFDLLVNYGASRRMESVGVVAQLYPESHPIPVKSKPSPLHVRTRGSDSLNEPKD